MIVGFKIDLHHIESDFVDISVGTLLFLTINNFEQSFQP